MDCRYKIEFLFFGDSNLGMFNRDVDFFRYIAKRRNETGYPRQIDYTTAKQQPKRIVELGEILNKEAKMRRGVTKNQMWVRRSRRASSIEKTCFCKPRFRRTTTREI